MGYRRVTVVLWRPERAGSRCSAESDRHAGPDECARAARAEASGPVLTRAMRAGETAFCVITNQDNIAWVLVTAASRDPGNGLSLTVTLWTPNP